MNGNDIMLLVLLSYLGLVFYLTVPRFLTRRFVPWVIKVFEEQKAIDAESARPIEKLFPVPFMQNLFRRREFLYQTLALEALARADIVRATRDGRLFLARERLHIYGLDK